MSPCATRFHCSTSTGMIRSSTRRPQFYGFYLAANGDEANTSGLEVELEGWLSDSFHYRLGYTYVDAELSKDFISPQSGDVVAEKGSTLPGAPENVFSVNFDNRWSLKSDMDLVLGVNVYSQSKSENYINQESVLNETFDSFMLVGATLSLVTDSWSAMLYMKNITDESGASGGFASTDWSTDTGVFENWYGNGNRQFIVQPQTIGLRIGYNF